MLRKSMRRLIFLNTHQEKVAEGGAEGAHDHPRDHRAKLNLSQDYNAKHDELISGKAE